MFDIRCQEDRVNNLLLRLSDDVRLFIFKFSDKCEVGPLPVYSVQYRLGLPIMYRQVDDVMPTSGQYCCTVHCRLGWWSM